MAKAKPKPSSKKRHKQPRRAKAVEPPPITGEMTVGEQGDSTIITGVVPTSRSRHGSRARRAKHDWALYAITMLDHCEPISRDVNLSKLTERVNKRLLNEEPEYRATGQGEISRNTVVTAFQAFARTRWGAD
jgi:hypothetical protein